MANKLTTISYTYIPPKQQAQNKWDALCLPMGYIRQVSTISNGAKLD